MTELLVLTLAFVALGVSAWKWGADTRTSCDWRWGCRG